MRKLKREIHRQPARQVQREVAIVLKRNEQPAQPVYLTPKLLSDRFRMHEESVRRLLRRRVLPSVIINRRRLVPLQAIEQFEKERLVAAA